MLTDSTRTFRSLLVRPNILRHFDPPRAAQNFSTQVDSSRRRSSADPAAKANSTKRSRVETNFSISSLFRFAALRLPDGKHDELSGSEIFSNIYFPRDLSQLFSALNDDLSLSHALGPFRFSNFDFPVHTCEAHQRWKCLLTVIVAIVLHRVISTFIIHPPDFVFLFLCFSPFNG
jgi:hypothetical protein